MAAAETIELHYQVPGDDFTRAGEASADLKARLKALEPVADLHDLRLVPGPTHTNVVFDLCLPADYKGDRAALVAALRAAAKEKDEKYNCVIQVEHSYVSCDEN